MKKALSLISFLLLLFISAYSQDNKPEANSFGLQYGVNFNGSIGQAVQFSGWIKNGLEIRGALTFSYSSSSTENTSGSSFQEVNRNNTYFYVPTIQTSTSSSASLTVTPTVSVVKHFPIKSNLDFFIGGSFSYGFTLPTAWTTNTSTTTADSFYSYTSTSSKSPITFNWGMSLLGGANYFFYKNLALGADFGIGFTASNSSGNYQEHDIRINSGSYNNSSNLNINQTYTNKVTNNRIAASLTGNAGLHLTYYLKVKPKKQSGDQKM